jgi:outer membrane biosynthesis protein TonB
MRIPFSRLAVVLAVLPACGDGGGRSQPTVSDRQLLAEHRMTPDQLRQMTGVDRLPVPADRGAFIASIAKHYPAAMRAAGVGGSALVDATIDAEGNVSAVEVVQRPMSPRTTMILRDAAGTERRFTPQDDPRFEAAARAALREVRFTPAVRDGQPVAYTMRMTISFDPPAK